MRFILCSSRKVDSPGLLVEQRKPRARRIERTGVMMSQCMWWIKVTFRSYQWTPDLFVVRGRRLLVASREVTTTTGFG